MGDVTRIRPPVERRYDTAVSALVTIVTFCALPTMPVLSLAAIVWAVRYIAGGG